MVLAFFGGLGMVWAGKILVGMSVCVDCLALPVLRQLPDAWALGARKFESAST